MQEYKVRSPVIIIVFNRYETTKKVFEQIKKVQPKKLFIIADGPRYNVKEDIEKCNKVREIFNDIDWKCEVYKNYANENLGCSKRPYTGITWSFDKVEEAIILEDDCLPNISFFKYCDDLLEKYRYDERIMLISGTNQLKKWRRQEYSYHFSNFGGIWGWATWKRAWKYFDINLKLWENETVKKLLKRKLTFSQYISRKNIYNKLCNNSLNTTAWDYQWGFARLVNSGLAISPCINMIKNIGNGEDATHTNKECKLANLETYNMNFPMKHPQFIMPDYEYDKKIYKKINGSYLNIIKDIVKNIIIGRKT